MNHYIQIQIKPDDEMRENVLLNKVYTKLHKALWTMKSTNVGVSFPKFNNRLGNIIRIHSKETQLRTLQEMKWLGGLTGYCSISTIRPIPDDITKYRIISRKQANMTKAKLRRLIKRGSISPDEIKNYKAKMFRQSLNAPFMELQSCSNGQKHRRYIDFSDIVTKPNSGFFDSFGLSKNATIPWW